MNVGTMGSTQLFPVDYDASQVHGFFSFSSCLVGWALLKLQWQVLAAIGKLPDDQDRGQAIKDMHDAVPTFIRNLHRASPFQGIVGLGGSGARPRMRLLRHEDPAYSHHTTAGTTIIAAAMRALPFSVAKGTPGISHVS